MPFTRSLPISLVRQLNELYESEGSWWRRLVDDSEVFMAIRPGAINAYAGGGSIARIDLKGRAMRLRVHAKYVVFAAPAAGENYCDLLAGEAPSPVIVSNVDDYGRELRRIKRASALLSGAERLAENVIAARTSRVLDMEAAFDSRRDSAEPDSEPLANQGRLDLVVVDFDGRLVVNELKLFRNSELRSQGGEPPAVCGQLIDYAGWLQLNAASVLSAYQRVAEINDQLRGRFFETRRPLVPRSIDPVPRLLIVGYGREDNSELTSIRERIIGEVQSRIPTFDKTRIRVVGNAGNVKDYHLI